MPGIEDLYYTYQNTPYRSPPSTSRFSSGQNTATPIDILMWLMQAQNNGFGIPEAPKSNDGKGMPAAVPSFGTQLEMPSQFPQPEQLYFQQQPPSSGGITSVSRIPPPIEAPNDPTRMGLFDWTEQRPEESDEEYRERLRAWAQENGMLPDETGRIATEDTSGGEFTFQNEPVISNDSPDGEQGLIGDYLDWVLRVTGLEEPAAESESGASDIPSFLLDPNATQGAPGFTEPVEGGSGDDTTQPSTSERILAMLEDYAFSRPSAYETDPRLAENAENLKPNPMNDLMRFGFGMAAGESPFFGVNVGNAGIGMLDAQHTGFVDYQNALYDIENLQLANQSAADASEANRMGAAADLYRLSQPQGQGDIWGDLPQDMVLKMFETRKAQIDADLSLTPEAKRALYNELMEQFMPYLGPFAPLLMGGQSGNYDFNAAG